jgi:hypothetical protein
VEGKIKTESESTNSALTLLVPPVVFPLNGCINLGKLLNLSGSQFPLLFENPSSQEGCKD